MVLGNEDASLLVSRVPRCHYGCGRGEPGERVLLGGVHCVGSGGDAAGGVSVVRGRDAIGERGAGVFWGWLLLDWWWNGWGDGW